MSPQRQGLSFPLGDPMNAVSFMILIVIVFFFLGGGGGWGGGGGGWVGHTLYTTRLPIKGYEP